MEELSTKLTTLKNDLEKLKDKPKELETKISSAQSKYTNISSGSEIKTEIDEKFKEAKTKVEQHINDFISKKKQDMIVDKSTGVN